MVPESPPRQKPSAASGGPLAVDLEDLRIHRDADLPVAGASRSPRRRRLWPLVLLLLVLGGIFVASRFVKSGPSKSVTRVRTATVRITGAPSAGARAEGFSAAGWVKLPLHHPVQVTPLVEGRIEEILVIEGDKVREGQLLARLYDKDYRATLDAAEAAVRASEAESSRMQAGFRKQEVAEAKAEVRRLEAELENAQATLRHSRELHPSGAIPREELLEDETKVAMLEAGIAKANERLALLVEGYRVEDIELSAARVQKAKAERDLARLRVGYTEIQSPMDGVVLERDAVQGQWIEPGKGVIVSLYDPRDLEARVDVNQDSVGKIHLGQDVEITTRAEARRIHPGRVVLIEPRADLVKNTVAVRVKILDADENSLLYPDMVVTARFRAHKAVEPGSEASLVPKARELTIPAAAVQDVDAAPYVWLVQEGQARRRPVTLAAAGGGTDERLVVQEGLEAGDRVVLDPPPNLEDGTRVEPLK